MANKKILNSSLPFGQIALKVACHGQVLVCSSLTHRASEDEKLLAQKENLVLGHSTTLFASPVIQSGSGCSKGG